MREAGRDEERPPVVGRRARRRSSCPSSATRGGGRRSRRGSRPRMQRTSLTSAMRRSVEVHAAQRAGARRCATGCTAGTSVGQPVLGELSLAERPGEEAALVAMRLELDQTTHRRARSARTASARKLAIRPRLDRRNGTCYTVRSMTVVRLPLLRHPAQAPVVDLGMSPLCESYLAADQLDRMEPFYPLHVWVCRKCFLVQLNEYVTRRGHLHRVRLLLLVLDELAGARRGLRRR